MQITMYINEHYMAQDDHARAWILLIRIENRLGNKKE